MPDQNPVDPAAQGAVTSFKDIGTVSESPPPPPMDSSDLPPAPPIVESTPLETPPVSDTGGAAPTFDISSSISGTPPPKKRFGGRKFVATILGLLVLVGGLGAGIILVQQQQDIRERAAGPGQSCTASGQAGTCTTISSCTLAGNTFMGTGSGGCTSPAGQNIGCCVQGKAAEPTKAPTKAPEPSPTTAPCLGLSISACSARSDCYWSANNCLPRVASPSPTLTPTTTKCTSDNQCPANNFCKEGRCVPVTASPTKAPTTTPGGAVCIDPTTSSAVGKACTNTSGTFTGNCVIIYCPNGLGSDGRCNLNDTGAWQKFGSCSSLWNSLGTNQCGQIDTVNQDGVYCIPQGVCESKIVNNPSCSSTPTQGGSLTAQCLNIRAFDTNWTELTVAQLSQLKAGDKVRFSVGGTASAGSFDKAKFKINGVERAEVATKRPSSNDFYDEYTVPEGITTFTINAQIHHTTLGWSN